MCTSKRQRKDPFCGRRPLLYYITDRKQLKGISLTGCMRRALDQGVDFIQIREKDLEDRALYELTCAAVRMARGTHCRILVNGRADIALAAGAHGVHLPSTGLKVPVIRAWLPADFLVGVSVHTLREINRACRENSDYILLGHVFPTESKRAYGPSLGLKFLRRACAAVSTPVFALGGIRPEHIRDVMECGAAGVAGIRLFQDDSQFPIHNS